MSDDYDQDQQGGQGQEEINYHLDNNNTDNQEETKTQEEETQPNETHGHSNETNDGGNVTNVTEISIEGSVKQDEFVDKESGIDPDSKKYNNNNEPSHIIPEITKTKMLDQEPDTSTEENLKELDDDSDIIPEITKTQMSDQEPDASTEENLKELDDDSNIIPEITKSQMSDQEPDTSTEENLKELDDDSDIPEIAKSQMSDQEPDASTEENLKELDDDSVFKESSSMTIEPKRQSHQDNASQIESNGITVTPTTAPAKNGSVSDVELKESLNVLRKAPDLNKMNSDFLNSLMDSYLDKDYVNRIPTLKKPTRSPKTSTTSSSTTKNDIAKMEELEKNLKVIREKNKKQAAPPVRNKPKSVSKSWEDPREQQRLKVKEKQWPPKEPPTDTGAYVVESYGRTDPYTKKLIKDVQRNKREDEERKEAEKRATVVSENAVPVKTLRDTFSSNPQKSALGTLRPQTELHTERSWIRHEKKPLVYEETPEEPDWMKLIRTRRWKSTVKAR